jgi:hypothetical protein
MDNGMPAPWATEKYSATGIACVASLASEICWIGWQILSILRDLGLPGHISRAFDTQNLVLSVEGRNREMLGEEETERLKIGRSPAFDRIGDLNFTLGPNPREDSSRRLTAEG